MKRILIRMATAAIATTVVGCGATDSVTTPDAPGLPGLLCGIDPPRAGPPPTDAWPVVAGPVAPRTLFTHFSGDVFNCLVSATSGGLHGCRRTTLPHGKYGYFAGVAADGRWAFVAWRTGRGGRGVSALALDERGGLDEVDAVPLEGGSVQQVVVHPTRRLVYVTTREGVSAYAVDPAGALHAVPGSPFPSGGGRLVVHPEGRLAYMTSCGCGVQAEVYRIGPSGALWPHASCPGETVTRWGSYPFAGPVIDPTGSLLVAASTAFGGGPAALEVFRIDPTTGHLTRTCSRPGKTVFSIAARPGCNLLFVGRGGDDDPEREIEIYLLHLKTGELQLLDVVRVSAEHHGHPGLIAVDSEGHFVFYVTTRGIVEDGVVSAYAIQPDGRLVPAPGGFLVYDPPGQFVFFRGPAVP